MKIMMNLTEQDVAAVSDVERLYHLSDHAQAVSIALSWARFIGEKRAAGARLLIRWPSGFEDEVIFPEDPAQPLK